MLKKSQIESIKEQLVGKTVKEAQAIVHGPLRIAVEDGVSSYGTCDYVPDRLNVEVTEGKISDVFGAG